MKGVVSATPFLLLLFKLKFNSTLKILNLVLVQLYNDLIKELLLNFELI